MSSGGMLYGGDEIGALVFDPGHHSFRVGYAQVIFFFLFYFPPKIFEIPHSFQIHLQEDTPKAEIPSFVGVGPTDDSNNGTTDLDTKPDNNITTSSNFKYYVDTNYITVPRAHMEIQPYMKDGMVENWDLFEKVLDYVYAKVSVASGILLASCIT
jgi:actin-like protein 6B